MNYQELAMAILEKVCESDEIRGDVELDLIDAMLIDSFTIITTLIEIEERLGVRLQPSDIEKENIRTVNNFASYLEAILEE